MERVTKLPKEAAGIWKPWERVRFKVVPCLTKRVLIWAQMVLGTRVASQMMIMPKISLVPST